MRLLDFIPAAIGVFFAWEGWSASSADGAFRLALDRATRERGRQSPLLFGGLLALGAAALVAVLVVQVLGFLFFLTDVATPYEHVRSVGKSLPSGTYSGWSLLCLFAGGILTCVGGLFGLAMAVSKGRKAPLPTKQEPATAGAPRAHRASKKSNGR